MDLTRKSPYLIEIIASSGLFDSAYYSNRSGIGGLDEKELIENFLDKSPEKASDPGPLFSSVAYLKMNPDVASSGLNPLVHYIKFGMPEGRPGFSAEKCREFFAGARDNRIIGLSHILPPYKKIKVLYTEEGNFFFSDIATYTAEFLRGLGWDAAVVSDRDPAALQQDGSIDLVVAPHEFMVIGGGQAWSERRRRNAAYFNTEQWQTTWFSKCFALLQDSRLGVLDLNAASVAAFRELNIRAAFLPLLPLKGTAFEQQKASVSRAFSRRKAIALLEHPEKAASRHYDVLFVAVMNKRREKKLAKLAPSLAQFRSFLHCPVLDRPVRRGNPDMLSGRDFTQLALNSKILLNIHRDEVGYFEWHRLFLYGVMNGCVVVTEPSFKPPILAEGEHYIEAPINEIPDLLMELLTTEQGAARLQEISSNGFALAERVAHGERFVEQ
ncbi:MAG TPA: hypothetical protein VGN97_11885 [Mesorhizobium sp.]|nr:hypothetical protein [Mesorhizobium sp.]